MTNAEIRELSTADLQEKVVSEKALLSRMKMNHAVSPLDNPLKISEARKLIARLSTELRQRTLNDNKS